MKKLFLIIPLILTLSSCNNQERNNGSVDALEVEMVTSTEEKLWQNNELEILNDSVPGISLLKPDTLLLEQTIDGFGACFNELGWDALNLLTEEEKQEILKEFFTPSGFNFTICRVPVGANDYARNWYSLNDTPGDFDMVNFSIERDRGILIPYIRQAMEYNPELKVWGSPWCPPAWMKTNNHYACRPDVVNDLPESGAGQEGTTQFIMEPEYLSAYALYFAKFVKAYREEGVNLYAIHVQNEPNSCQNFPSCVWTSSDQAKFIGEYLGPEFDEQKLDAEIWYGTYERPWVENIDTIMQDEKASDYIAGIGFQWDGKKAVPGVNEKYPEMRLMQTESECGDGSNDWDAAEYTWSLIRHYLENGTNTYLYWNMILDETGKSQWGWKQNSLISVDSQTREYTLNPEYYLFRHLSHFVKPGAKKLSTPEGYQESLFFQNPDGELCALMANTSDNVKTLQVVFRGQYVKFSLEPRSFNSLTFK